MTDIHIFNHKDSDSVEIFTNDKDLISKLKALTKSSPMNYFFTGECPQGCWFLAKKGCFFLTARK